MQQRDRFYKWSYVEFEIDALWLLQILHRFEVLAPTLRFGPALKRSSINRASKGEVIVQLHKVTIVRQEICSNFDWLASVFHEEIPLA